MGVSLLGEQGPLIWASRLGPWGGADKRAVGFPVFPSLEPTGWLSGVGAGWDEPSLTSQSCGVKASLQGREFSWPCGTGVLQYAPLGRP